MEYIFSYGTIKDKYPNLTHIKGTLTDYVELFTGNMYPELYVSDNINRIEGIVIGVDKKTLATIDAYEGYPSLYDRKRFLVKARLKVSRNPKTEKANNYYADLALLNKIFFNAFQKYLHCVRNGCFS